MQLLTFNPRFNITPTLLVLLTVSVFGLPVTGAAAPVQLHDLTTGLNAPAGVADPNWDVTSETVAMGEEGPLPRDARTITRYNFGGAAWFSLGSGAQWISPTHIPGVSSGNFPIPTGIYFLDINFDLVKTGPELFAIDGTMATGRTIIFSGWLNGTKVVNCCPGIDPASSVGSSLLDSSTPLFINDQSLFVNGTNTLRFEVSNGNPGASNPFGFGFLGGVFAIPIPPSLSLMASALISILITVGRVER